MYRLITALAIVFSLYGFSQKPPEGMYRLRISYYNPALGGTNCHPSNWKNNECTTWLYGYPWQYWIGTGAACDNRFPIGTKLYLVRLKRVVTCVDRGGAIVALPDGTGFVDVLDDKMPWIKDWKRNIIVDQFCPSGCFWTLAYDTSELD